MELYYFCVMIRILSIVLLCALVIAGCGNGEDSTNVPATDTLQVDTASVDDLSVQLDAINKRILDDPNNSNFHHERATLHIKVANFPAALNDLERAIAIDSTVAAYHYTKGEVLYLMGKTKDAKVAFEKCLQYDEEHVQAIMKIAEYYLILRRYEECVDKINEALKIDEFLANAYYMKGWAYKEAGDTALAVSSLYTAVETDPDYYEAYVQLGILHAAHHNVLAIDFYNSALSIRPQSTEALYNKGVFCQEHEMIDMALQCYDQIILINPNHPNAHYNKGFVKLEYLQDYAEAIKDFTKAIEVAPNFYQAYYNRGYCYELMDDKRNALSDYNSSLNLNPDFSLAALGKGRVE